MTRAISRRGVLAGGAVLAAAGAGLRPRMAGAAGRPQLVARLERDLQNLDPAYRISTVESNILVAVHRGLVKFRRGSIEHELDAAAELRQTSPTELDFTLKPGIAFQVGYGEMTADDVKFSFERFNLPDKDGKKPTYAADWGALDHVEILDKYRGRIVLKRPNPALFTIALGSASGVILSRKATLELGDKALTRAVGAGAYEQAEWVPGQRLVLKAYPGYGGAAAAFPEIVLRPVADDKTAELAFRGNELDFTRLDLTATDVVARSPGAKLLRMDGIDYIWIGLNVEKPPLDQLKLRQALRLAIDVDAVLTAAYDGKVGRARALIPPQLLGHWAEAPLYPHDPAQAKHLLAEAGHGSGLKLKLTLLNQTAYRTAGQVVQANLAEIGVDCELEALDGGSYWSAGEGERGKELELSLQLFKGKMDPSFFTQWFVSGQVGSWNWQRWRNPEYDRLDALAAATIDPAERARTLIRMQQLMDESAAFIWLTHDVLAYAHRDWLAPAILPGGNDWQLADFRPA